MAKRPTIYDVAKAAGVSHQTVSRVIKEHPVAPETRKHVEQVIQELGYRRNLAAQALATNRSRRIGALANEMLEAGPSKILQGASNEARAAGYLLDIVSLDPTDPTSTQEALTLLGQQDLAGVLAIAPTEQTRDLLRQSVGVPLHITGEVDDEQDGTVRNGIGTRMAVEHLLGLGHQRIALVTGPTAWTTARNAEYAYRVTLQLAGARPLPVVSGDWSAASGFEAVHRLPWAASPTAVVAGNDQMALGVIAGLTARGLRVPDDISVIGFDDIPESAFFLPPLTTLAIDFDLRGRQALRNVLHLIEGDAPSEDPLSDLPRLIVRHSTRPAPSS